MRLFDTRMVIFDSGGYEVSSELPEDNLYFNYPGILKWNEEMYVNCANKYVLSNSILVSYDRSDLDISDQFKMANLLYNDINKEFKRDYLIKNVNHIKIGELIENIKENLDIIDFIGFTEKDFKNIYSATSFIYKVRSKLNLLNKYVPIHIFGCMEPRSIKPLFLAGADIFDGISWLRYSLNNGYACHRKEYERNAIMENIIELNSQDIQKEMYKDNVLSIETMSSDLAYMIGVGDLEGLEEDIYLIFKGLERE